MGLFSGLLGHASEVEEDKYERLFNDLLADNEEVEQAFKLIRDMLVFTNRRLMLIDKQGVTGKRTTVTSIPYRKINKWMVDSAGHLDMDAEIYMWLEGEDEPIQWEFKGNVDIRDIQRRIAEHVC